MMPGFHDNPYNADKDKSVNGIEGNTDSAKEELCTAGLDSLKEDINHLKRKNENLLNELQKVRNMVKEQKAKGENAMQRFALLCEENTALEQNIQERKAKMAELSENFQETLSELQRLQEEINSDRLRTKNEKEEGRSKQLESGIAQMEKELSRVHRFLEQFPSEDESQSNGQESHWRRIWPIEHRRIVLNILEEERSTAVRDYETALNEKQEVEKELEDMSKLKLNP